MNGKVIMFFDKTVEELCFIAKYLVDNEDLENKVIIQAYKYAANRILSDGDYTLKKMEIELINLIMEQHVSKGSVLKEEFSYIRMPNIDETIVDKLIFDYFAQKRDEYTVDNNRLELLRKSVVWSEED